MTTQDIATVLLVCADDARSAYLADQLTADGFDVVPAGDVPLAVRSLDRVFPDLVLVDSDVAGQTGLQVVAAVRGADRVTSRVDPATPVVVLASRPDVLERVRALERGADDVLTLPVHYPELLARVRSVLRRAHGRRGQGILRVGPLEVDPVSRTVTLEGAGVELSQKEWALLQVLAAEPTRVFSKEELLRSVWGFRSAGRTRTLDSHACRLRQKLCASGGRFIVNVWGVGYRLVDGPLGVADEAYAPTARDAPVAGRTLVAA